MDRLTAFDPPPDELDALLDAVGGLVRELVHTAADRPVFAPEPAGELTAQLLDDRPGEKPVPIDEALAVVRRVLATGVDNAAAGELAYIPGSGLVTAALGDLVAAVANRHTGLASFTPAAVALEQAVLRWLAALFELPSRAQGLLLSGGSAANLIAIVAARERLARDRVDRATVYVGRHAHASVRKAARIAGVPAAHIRACGEPDELRLDPEHVRVAVKEDLALGRIPIAIIAAAGTTNTGAVDPLDELAVLAEELGIWYHVDAAYGGFFQLTDRGRSRLAGIGRADSITLDPHKSLFLPFGTGALLVRDRDDLAHAFVEDADYLRDHSRDLDALPDFSVVSPELTREWRGLRMWLPLTLHGVGAFRAALDDKLDLAAMAAARLDAHPGIDLVGVPDLSIVTFRAHGDDALQDAVLRAVHADGRIRLSSTRIGERVALRLAVLSHRTTRATVDLALDAICTAADALVTASGGTIT